MLTLRIVQISDFHFTRLTWNPFRLFSKRILGHLNWLFCRTHAFCEQILEDLPPLFEELKVDKILLGGDFTTTALKEEFEAAKKFVDKISPSWLAIPGNHDVYTYRSHRKKLFYQYFQHPKVGSEWDRFRLAKDHVEIHQLDETYWLMSLDVCRATNVYSSRGLFSEEIEKTMKEALSLLPSHARIVVWSHYPFFQHDAHRRILKRGEKLKQILQEDRRICLFLHGHTHRNTIANLLPSHLPVVADSGSCAEKKHASWNLIDLTPVGCKITAYQYQEGWKPSRTEEILWKN